MPTRRAVVTFRTPLHLLPWYVGFGVFVLLGLAMVIRPDDPSTRVLGGLTVAIWTPMLIRLIRSGVFLSEEGVLVRGVLRTYRLPWSTIKRAGQRPTWPWLPGRVLVIHRNTDRDVLVNEIGGVARDWGSSTLLDAIDSINTRVGTRDSRVD